MRIYHKLYLTGMLVLDMAMTNYCYNTYGLSPDFNFFDAERAEYVESVASSNKARFISNYTQTYDNIISGMAIMDDTVSPGAVFADYRKALSGQISVDGINIRVPDAVENLDSALELKLECDYAGNADSGTIYHNGVPVAAVRVKNGMFYRLSGSDPVFRIGEISVGDNIYTAVRKWGMPSGMDAPIYCYSVGERASITLLADPEGTITWMLYESLGREIEKGGDISIQDEGESVQTIKTGDVPINSAVKPRKERSYPVAEYVLEYNHGTKSKKETKTTTTDTTTETTTKIKEVNTD